MANVYAKEGLYFLASIAYKCIYGLAPDLLCNELEMFFDRHGLNARHSNTMNDVQPKPNVECFKKAFQYAIGKVWNNLSSNIQNIQSLNTFNRT